MSYKFDGFHGRALYELNGLPQEVRDGALLERLIELLRNPWDAVAERPGQSVVRQAFFGDDSQGMITFILDEDTQTLRIIDILWIG
ncbi:hypothetical protein ACQP1K_21830 [Sphaerimonospora sp. CA-214678]|uniref:hypothetical protein n=1 Tax=Sphaerimonospora sp. CA-214678 TaxID=3240029 RepID=UPI003D8F03FC